MRRRQYLLAIAVLSDSLLRFSFQRLNLPLLSLLGLINLLTASEFTLFRILGLYHPMPLLIFSSTVHPSLSKRSLTKT